MDPLTQSYPWYTPYQFAANTPIIAIDLDGLEMETKIAVYHGMRASDDPSLSTTEAMEIYKSTVNSHKIFANVPPKYIAFGVFSGIALGLTGGAAGPYIEGYFFSTLAKTSIAVSVNAETIIGVGGLAMSLIDDDPNNNYPGGFDDLFRGAKLLLGKSHVLKQVKSLFPEASHMHNSFDGLEVPSNLSGPSQLFQAMYDNVKKGRQIVFDITDVVLDKAKKGFESFNEADANRNITEWELSKILRDPELFNNTRFFDGKVEKSAKDLGLELIKE